ncbi:hypothetical protein [Romboutsia sp.]|uniref:hypothetical protein n=1 Tax=Romboutsia sp. TaxID=1965302 RepID=UPI003F385FF5
MVKKKDSSLEDGLESNIEKIVDFFTNKLKESDSKEKVSLLINYSYCWYLGLRGKNIFEEEVAIQDFLNQIWNCYGVFSGAQLSIMHHREKKSYKEGEKRLLIDDELIKNFYSYDNQEIADYLPANVVLTISDNGLYQIVRFRAFDD